jgi:hypothetical protein
MSLSRAALVAALGPADATVAVDLKTFRFSTVIARFLGGKIHPHLPGLLLVWTAPDGIESARVRS